MSGIAGSTAVAVGVSPSFGSGNVGAGGVPPVSDFFLLESGDSLLLENGSKLQLETIFLIGAVGEFVVDNLGNFVIG